LTPLLGRLPPTQRACARLEDLAHALLMFRPSVYAAILARQTLRRVLAMNRGAVASRCGGHEDTARSGETFEEGGGEGACCALSRHCTSGECEPLGAHVGARDCSPRYFIFLG